MTLWESDKGSTELGIDKVKFRWTVILSAVSYLRLGDWVAFVSQRGTPGPLDCLSPTQYQDKPAETLSSALFAVTTLHWPQCECGFCLGLWVSQYKYFRDAEFLHSQTIRLL